MLFYIKVDNLDNRIHLYIHDRLYNISINEREQITVSRIFKKTYKNDDKETSVFVT